MAQIVFAILSNNTYTLWHTFRDSHVRDKESKQIPTFSEGDHDQGSVHEDGVRQVLRNSHRLRLKEFYKTDTWSHRQGRVTEKKYKYVVQRIQTRRANMPFSNCKFVPSGTAKFLYITSSSVASMSLVSSSDKQSFLIVAFSLQLQYYNVNTNLFLKNKTEITVAFNHLFPPVGWTVTILLHLYRARESQPRFFLPVE